ncbi:TolC family protein [Variovorax sp. H27-G14]|uniref:TolC family protein n=1 Tax=Variovorax sp. H27-G14 TaxID=3111914 RepID=UPI0038FD397B
MTKLEAPRALSVLAAAAVLLLSGCAMQTRPIEMGERRAAIVTERTAITANQEALSGPVTLDEAMARALKYNLDYRLKRMEEVLAQRQLDLSQNDLLPQLTVAAGYAGRNNENGSSSRSLSTGAQSLVPSTSTDRDRVTGDLGLTWNVLDFGVSYFQSQQQADRVLVAQERRRKTVHQVMQQVRQAYWQAAGAEKLGSKIDVVVSDARRALDDSRKIEQEKLMAPLEVLNYQRQLLDVIRQLEAINDELSQAKPQLASLMNLEPGTRFTIALPTTLAAPSFKMPVGKMEETALLLRPELMEARYNERISVLETKKAITRLLPGLEFGIGQHYDSNSFLVNSNWRDAGLRVSFNLFNLINAQSIRANAQAQEELARQQHLAVSMAVLTQTHVALRDYTGRLRQYELSKDMDDVDQKFLGHVRNATRASATGKLQEVRAAASALTSELRLYQSYGAMQNAYGQMLSTLGLDPLPASIDSHDLSALRSAVGSMEARWADEVSKTQ